MTEFSPDMQRRLDDIRQRHEQQSQALRDEPQARLERNRNALSRLVQDARALGEIALERDVQPTVRLGHESFKTNFWSRRTNWTFDSTHEGWLLTWKGIFGNAQPPNATNAPASGGHKAARGFITMLGTDCNLYAAETHKYLGPLSNPIDTVTFSTVSHREVGQLGLASPGSSHLGADNPTVLTAETADHIVSELDTDVLGEALLELAKEKRL